MLANVGRDVGVAVLRQLPQLLDHVLRLDDFAAVLVAQALALAPLIDLPPPRRERRHVGPGLSVLDLRDQLLQNVFYITDDRDVDLDPLADARRVDVDVNDLALDRREVLGVADHAVIEARADCEQHVAVLHRHVGFVGAVHAEHAKELRVAGRHRTQAHQRVRAWVAEQVDELAQLGRCVAENHAAAGVDVRPLGVEQQLHCLANLPAMAFAHRVVRTHFDRGRIVVRRRLQRHVLRDVDDHRPRSTGARDVERLLHRHR